MSDRLPAAAVLAARFAASTTKITPVGLVDRAVKAWWRSFGCPGVSVRRSGVGECDSWSSGLR